MPRTVINKTVRPLQPESRHTRVSRVSPGSSLPVQCEPLDVEAHLSLPVWKGRVSVA